MPYCPECGNKISITDKRCSKCGIKLTPDIISDTEEFIDNINPVKKGSSKKYNTIEFILAIIAVVLTVLSLSQALSGYSLMEYNVLILVLILVLIGVIAAIITRYHAKIGSILLLVTIFIFVILGVQQMILPIIFAVATAIVAFVLN